MSEINVLCHNIMDDLQKLHTLINKDRTQKDDATLFMTRIIGDAVDMVNLIRVTR
jgi:hypothetical protein